MTDSLAPELLQAQAQVYSKLEQITKALTSSDPMLGMHCDSILRCLRENEELIHILPDDRIAVLMGGMMKYKNVKLIEEASKTRSKGKVSADDL